MRFAVVPVLVLQIGLAMLAGAQSKAATEGAPAGRLILIPIDRTRVLLALPERPPQAQPRPRASASPAPAARALPILPPAVRAQ